ncbi:MAG TPA: hypothetical protein VM144_14820 [Aestuariivirga sp.]|nr:hypothetical protein [Aestuariivirga sp.]
MSRKAIGGSIFSTDGLTDIIAKKREFCSNADMVRVIICVMGILLFPSSAYALTCNQWYDTMGGFIAEGKKIQAELKSLEKDAAAACTFSRNTQIPIMRRNLQMIRNFYPCGAPTGVAARETAASIRHVLQKLVNDTASKCLAAGM